ncbi:hypothetical protein [Jannaschia sp. R86511]
MARLGLARRAVGAGLCDAVVLTVVPRARLRARAGADPPVPSP